jgi:hypothetical protein
MESSEALVHLRSAVNKLRHLNEKLRDTQIVELSANASLKTVQQLEYYATSIVEAIEDIKAVQGGR